MRGTFRRLLLSIIGLPRPEPLGAPGIMRMAFLKSKGYTVFCNQGRYYWANDRLTSGRSARYNTALAAWHDAWEDYQHQQTKGNA